MENELKAIIASHHAPADLTIIYDDMHGMWGGSILTLRGDGSLERQTKATGSQTAEIVQTKISERELVELIRLLVELSAWEQRTPEPEFFVVGESHARLKISIQGGMSSIWERFNHMQANNRLIQIKNWMETL
jgi:hypothetical protein